MKKLIIAFSFLALSCGVLQARAASSGPLSPATTVDDATVGTVAWSNPNNAQVSDGVYATAALQSQFTHYLEATNFGFAIPAGANINGILVEIEQHQDGAADIRNLYAKIVKGGSIGTTNQANSDALPTSDAYKSYGSSSYLWGLSWTPTDINASNFGFVYSAQTQTAFAGNAYVDHIRITVYYTFITISNPTFVPAAGTYSGTQSVAITSATGGTTICYTTDSSTPTTNGAGTCTHGTTLANGGSVSVSVSETIKAVGTQSGDDDSSVVSAAYTITTPSSSSTVLSLSNSTLSVARGTLTIL